MEGDPQPEPIRERDLFLDRLAVMQLAVLDARITVVGMELGQQMPAVGGGIDEQILGRGRNRTFERGLERLVA